MVDVMICREKDTFTGVDVGMVTNVGNIYSGDIIMEYTYLMLERVTRYMHKFYSDLGNKWELSPLLSRVISFGSIGPH